MIFTKEPTAIIGFIVLVINAIIPVLLIFNVITWTPAQIGAVTVFIGVISTGLGTIFIRSQVTPTAIANQQIQKAIDEPKGSTTVEDVVKKVEVENANK